MKKVIISFTFLIVLSGITLAQDSLETATDDTVFVMTKSPWGAVARSAVLPGWGQLYNESYYKIPVIWGVNAWLIYNWVQNNNDYKRYGNLYTSSQNSNFRTYRDFYRDQRDLFAVYLGLTYVLNLVDAYVDAHLFDFTIEEFNNIQVPSINFKYYFK